MADKPDADARSPFTALEGDPVVASVRKYAFGALREGRAHTAVEIAERLGFTTAEVEGAVGALRAAGAIELDKQGRITGAHGLTLRETVHAIVTPDSVWHTWCALDAVGIPAALGVDAEVHTVCPTCEAAIVLEVRSGTVSAAHGTEPVLWLPGGPCGHVMDDFCAAANLFCNGEHLDAWRARAANPSGESVTLAEAEAHGRRLWADVSCC
jgi:predicted transcriptional regulator